MNKKNLAIWMSVATLAVIVGMILAALPAGAQENEGFVHGIRLTVDGEDYYLAGPPEGPNGESDLPGHYWTQLTPTELLGLHYNTGPGGAAQWWSSDAPDGELLYVVNAVIDTWTPQKAAWYASQGFVHYHELASAEDGSLHPDKVVWLRHIAVSSFTLDGGPHPELAYEATPGLNLNFIPNGMMPYVPDAEGDDA